MTSLYPYLLLGQAKDRPSTSDNPAEQVLGEAKQEDKSPETPVDKSELVSSRCAVVHSNPRASAGFLFIP